MNFDAYMIATPLELNYKRRPKPDLEHELRFKKSLRKYPINAKPICKRAFDVTKRSMIPEPGPTYAVYSTYGLNQNSNHLCENDAAENSERLTHNQAASKICSKNSRKRYHKLKSKNDLDKNLSRRASLQRKLNISAKRQRAKSMTDHTSKSTISIKHDKIISKSQGSRENVQTKFFADSVDKRDQNRNLHIFQVRAENCKHLETEANEETIQTDDKTQLTDKAINKINSNTKDTHSKKTKLKMVIQQENLDTNELFELLTVDLMLKDSGINEKAMIENVIIPKGFCTSVRDSILKELSDLNPINRKMSLTGNVDVKKFMSITNSSFESKLKSMSSNFSNILGSDSACSTVVFNTSRSEHDKYFEECISNTDIRIVQKPKPELNSTLAFEEGQRNGEILLLNGKIKKSNYEQNNQKTSRFKEILKPDVDVKKCIDTETLFNISPVSSDLSFDVPNPYQKGKSSNISPNIRKSNKNITKYVSKIERLNRKDTLNESKSQSNINDELTNRQNKENAVNTVIGKIECANNQNVSNVVENLEQNFITSSNRQKVSTGTKSESKSSKSNDVGKNLQNTLNGIENEQSLQSGTKGQESNGTKGQESNGTKGQESRGTKGQESRNVSNIVKHRLTCVKNEPICFKNELTCVKHESSCFKNQLTCLKNVSTCIQNDVLNRVKNNLTCDYFEGSGLGSNFKDRSKEHTEHKPDNEPSYVNSIVEVKKNSNENIAISVNNVTPLDHIEKQSEDVLSSGNIEKDTEKHDIPPDIMKNYSDTLEIPSGMAETEKITTNQENNAKEKINLFISVRERVTFPNQESNVDKEIFNIQKEYDGNDSNEIILDNLEEEIKTSKLTYICQSLGSNSRNHNSHTTGSLKTIEDTLDHGRKTRSPKTDKFSVKHNVKNVALSTEDLNPTCDCNSRSKKLENQQSKKNAKGDVTLIRTSSIPGDKTTITRKPCDNEIQNEIEELKKIKIGTEYHSYGKSSKSGDGNFEKEINTKINEIYKNFIELDIIIKKIENDFDNFIGEKAASPEKVENVDCKENDDILIIDYEKPREKVDNSPNRTQYGELLKTHEQQSEIDECDVPTIQRYCFRNVTQMKTNSGDGNLCRQNTINIAKLGGIESPEKDELKNLEPTLTTQSSHPVLQKKTTFRQIGTIQGQDNANNIIIKKDEEQEGQNDDASILSGTPGPSGINPNVLRRASYSPLMSLTSQQSLEPMIVVQESTCIDEEDETEEAQSPTVNKDSDALLNPGLLYPYRDIRKRSLPTPQCTSGITASQVRRLSDQAGTTGTGAKEAAFLATLTQAPVPASGGRRHSVITISPAPPLFYGRNRRESIAAFPQSSQFRRDSNSSIARSPSGSITGSNFTLHRDIMDDIAEIKTPRKVRMKMWQTEDKEKVCEFQSMEGGGPSSRYHQAVPGIPRDVPGPSRRYSDISGIQAISKQQQSQSQPPQRRRASEAPSNTRRVSTPPLPSSEIVISNTELKSILSNLTSSAQEISNKMDNIAAAGSKLTTALDQKRNLLKGSRSNSFDISMLPDGKKVEKEKSSNWFTRRHLPMSNKTSTSDNQVVVTMTDEKPRTSILKSSKTIDKTITALTGGETGKKPASILKSEKSVDKKDTPKHKVAWNKACGSMVDAHLLGSVIEGFLNKKTTETTSGGASGTGGEVKTKSSKSDPEAATGKEETASSSLVSTLKDLFVK
ncbi:hypothetical protein M8J75_013802 [Diaphorina citri]|nr:hypothetical protein M8J75_013802 [Diaphorina citri]